VVGALDFGSSDPGSRPGRGHCVVSVGQDTTPTVTLSTQVYEWVPANLMLGVTLRWTSTDPVQGGVEVFLVAWCCRGRDKIRSGEPLGLCADFTSLDGRPNRRNSTEFHHF